MKFALNRLDMSGPLAFAESAARIEDLGWHMGLMPCNPLKAPDPYLSLAFAAQATTTLHLGTLLDTPVLRHPSVLAGSISTVAQMAPGRVHLGLGIGDTAVLVLLSIGASIVVALVGVIPVIGTVGAAVLGFLATARALSWELTLAPFGTRGLVGRDARLALRRRRSRSFGFGAAVQACFLIPFGAVIAMPAAAAGAILLVRDVLNEDDSPAPSASAAETHERD